MGPQPPRIRTCRPLNLTLTLTPEPLSPPPPPRLPTTTLRCLLFAGRTSAPICSPSSPATYPATLPSSCPELLSGCPLVYPQDHPRHPPPSSPSSSVFAGRTSAPICVRWPRERTPRRASTRAKASSAPTPEPPSFVGGRSRGVGAGDQGVAGLWEEEGVRRERSSEWVLVVDTRESLFCPDP